MELVVGDASGRLAGQAGAVVVVDVAVLRIEDIKDFTGNSESSR